jgi:HEPN domain-containing protein
MQRKQSDENDPADWFYLAGDRLKIADLAWKHEGLTASGIELLQESVERYLKGYLIARGWKLIRTHDLDYLVTTAADFDPRFKQFQQFAEQLTEDFFAQHYPGEDWQLVGRNYETLRKQTDELIRLIQESLPVYFDSDTKQL